MKNTDQGSVLFQFICVHPVHLCLGKFLCGQYWAIRLPKEFRVATAEVRLTRVPGGILVTEGDPWETFQDECRSLPEGVFASLRIKRQISCDRGCS